MNFRKVLKEVNLILDEVLLFDVILNSVIIFLAVYLALVLLNFNPWYALFPTLGYFVYLLYIDVRQNKFVMVEKAYTPLYERLRTAADNVDKENEFVQALQEEVVEALKKVQVSSFVRIPRITGKMLASVFLCFAILLAAIYNVNLGSIDFSFADKLKGFMYGQGEEGDGEGTFENVAGLGGSEDIFGEESLSVIGAQELDIRLQQASIEVSSSELEDPPQSDFEEAFPDEISATSTGSFEEKINVEDQKLIKEYFKELARA
ncbi:hypothetical protein HYU13_00335 [Candidatus Woesearchaeota archaeon]|nr:hypothetical protein [Candidatus Woesearchaeota archaeon]